MLLREIYSVFTSNLIFKGATTMKYFFSLNRFSEDLDFTFTGQNETSGRKYLNEKMGIALNHLSAQYQIVERVRRASETGNITVGIFHELRIKGPLSQRSGQLQNIKMDISLNSTKAGSNHSVTCFSS